MVETIVFGEIEICVVSKVTLQNFKKREKCFFDQPGLIVK